MNEKAVRQRSIEDKRENGGKRKESKERARREHGTS